MVDAPTHTACDRGTPLRTVTFVPLDELQSAGAPQAGSAELDRGVIISDKARKAMPRGVSG